MSRKRRYDGGYDSRKRRKHDYDSGAEAEESLHLDYLFAAIDSKAHPKELTTHWLEVYEKDPPTGLAAAVNLLCKFAGASLIVTQDDLDLDMSRVIASLEDNADDDSKGEPPVWRFRKKPFRKRYFDFWKRLIKETKHAILHDEYFLQNFIDWCAGLSKSNLRSFREAATETSFGLMEGLIEAVVLCEDELDKCETRLNRTRHRENIRKDVLENLEDNQKELQSTIEAIHNYCQSVFNLVFVRRYRDIFPSIRIRCMESLGSWMSRYPSFFLEDTKLKYVGWCLSDKNASVRLASVDTIHKIYEDPENIIPMTNFLDRFKTRLLEMSKDIDNAVSASAINLASKMLKNDLLKTNDGDDIQSYIYDQDETIRRAAASFIYHDSFVLPEDDDKDPEQIDRDDVLEVLAIFGNEMAVRTDHGGELDTPANYLVSTMWDSLGCLKAWGVMIDMLLHSERTENELRESALVNKQDNTVLDSNSETLLLYLILSCAKMAKGTLIIGSDKKRRKRSKQLQELDQHVWETFLEVFLPRIPEIFQIVQTDAKKINALVQILRVIPCEEWSYRKKKDLFVKILQLIQKVFQQNTDQELLIEISNTLSKFVYEEHDLAGESQRCAVDLARQLKVKYTELNNLFDYGVLSEDDSRNFLNCLLRIKCLKKAIHVPELHFDDSFKKTLNECLFSSDKHQYCVPLLELACFDLWWIMCDTNFDDINEQEVEIIRQLKNYILENISYALTVLDGSDDNIITLVDSLCEILLVLKPGESERLNSRLCQPLGEDDMNNVLRIFASRFENLSEEQEDEYEDKVLKMITHCFRLCLSDPKAYGRFGALGISQLTRFSLRSDDLIKHCQSVIKKNYGHQVLQDIQFEALRHIFEDTEYDTGNSDRLESVAKTLSKVHGVDTTGLDFRPILNKCLDYGLKDAPAYVDFLFTVKPFFQRSQKKHKKDIFQRFSMLENSLPSYGDRQEDDAEAWKIFDSFKSFLREQQRKGSRNIDADENWL